MSAETRLVLQGMGKVHRTTGFRSASVRAQLARAVRKARHEGAAVREIAIVAGLGITTVRGMA